MELLPGGMGHRAFGWDGGFGASWRVDPANGLVVIVPTQRLWDSPELPPVQCDIQAAVYSGFEGE